MEIPVALITFLLVLTRIGSYLVSMPILSGRQVPKIMKLGLVLALSYLSFLTIGVAEVLNGSNELELILFCVQEAVIGLLFGMVSTIVFLGIQTAGDFIDSFVGLKMSSSYDPITGSSGSIYSNLYNWLAVVLFFLMNGHHYLIKGIVNTFYFLPLGQTTLELSLIQISMVITKSFLISIQLAIPICIILFLVDLILGIISRSVPQMNVFILGMPLKLLISFIMMGVIIVGIAKSIGLALDSVIQILNDFIKAFG